MSDWSPMSASTAQRLLARSYESLLGICAGIMADGELNDKEISFLDVWLSENTHIARTWPGEVIYERVKSTLSDGRITAEEREHLAKTIHDLLGATYLETGAADGAATRLPVSQIDSITIQGKCFCFTGDFLFGTRTRCTRAVLDRGGTASETVNGEIDYLVIGTMASRAWAHTSYGRKIEAAVELQKQGVPLLIVSEEQWVRFLLPANRGEPGVPLQCPTPRAGKGQGSGAFGGKTAALTGGMPKIGRTDAEHVVQAVMHWMSPGGADIETLGLKKVEQLADAGMLKRLSDLYRLEKDKIAALEGWGDRSAEDVLEAIEGSKTVAGDRFLFSLGIRHVGEKLAREIVRGFPSLDALTEATEEQVMHVDGIGPEIAQSVVSFFREVRNRELLAELKSLGVRPAWPKPREKKAEGTGPFAGKTVVFTGTLSSMERAQGEKLVESLGGKASSSVSKKTDFVVEGEKAGSKAEKARSLGIRVLTEAEFLRMAGRKGDGSLFST
jgi:NAD-dependent DNA ligase